MRLKRTFTDRDLPIRVDVAVWVGISPRFRELIEAESIVLQGRGGSDLNPPA